MSDMEDHKFDVSEYVQLPSVRRICSLRERELLKVIADLAYAIEDHKTSSSFCPECGFEDPCESDDVCMALNTHATIIDQARKANAEGVRDNAP